MPELTHIEALVRAHAHGDDDQFYSIALSCAARLARGGDAEGGKSLRDLIDRARSRMELPAFSGRPKACAKCDYAPLNERCATDRFTRESGAEFLARTCRNCGYTWYERCADAGGSR